MSAAVQHHSLQLTTAYSVCRHIARSSAKNFYYGFMVLPRRKRNALSAVYAFMRHADDLSDDPGMSVHERRRKLTEFIEGYRRVSEGAPTDDPVFMALRDSQERYHIPFVLLEQLVQGTGMDIQEAGPETADAQPLIAYQTFSELYDYCYHVASVVGLVCIRIFGYRDPAAEQLAEHVGIAFQLTNILRDVKEDAQMGRVYIPQEDLDRFGVSVAELASGTDMARLRPLLEMEASRAKEFYVAAGELLPLIDDESQPALWTLVEIYHGLLGKIETRGYDVYTERVRLTVPEKLKILGKGFFRRLT